MISCANKILSRRNKLKNKTRMSLPGFRKILSEVAFIQFKLMAKFCNFPFFFGLKVYRITKAGVKRTLICRFRMLQVVHVPICDGIFRCVFSGCFKMATL